MRYFAESEIAGQFDNYNRKHYFIPVSRMITSYGLHIQNIQCRNIPVETRTTIIFAQNIAHKHYILDLLCVSSNSNYNKEKNICSEGYCWQSSLDSTVKLLSPLFLLLFLQNLGKTTSVSPLPRLTHKYYLQAWVWSHFWHQMLANISK